jgi:hypothetical protein
VPAPAARDLRLGYVTGPAAGSPGFLIEPGAAGRRHDPAEPGRHVELGQVIGPGQLGLEPPTAIMRLAARRSARRYRRKLAATG